MIAETEPSPASEGCRPGVLLIAATGGLLAIAVMVVAAVVIATSSHHDGDAVQRPSVATVQLDRLPEPTSVLYQYAGSHTVAFSQIPCFCGCQTMLGHRNLTDCFVTSDGASNSHASGCAVCTNEGTTARSLLDHGTPAEAVRAEIIDQFGPSSTTLQGATT